MHIQFGLMIVIAYLVGSIPAAYIAGRLSRGIDLREFGSGNAGAGNLLKATGDRKLAAVVIAWDLVKGGLMVCLAGSIGLGIVQQVVVGLCAIAGHDWSIFLRFSAGRGVLTTVGAAFVLMPLSIVVFCVIGCLTLLRMTSPLPVLAAIAAMPLVSWLLHYPSVVTMGLLAMFLILVIRRLTAPRTGDVPLSFELLVNRFFFDRDIRDGKGWVTRRIGGKSGPTEPKRDISK